MLTSSLPAVYGVVARRPWYPEVPWSSCSTSINKYFQEENSWKFTKTAQGWKSFIKCFKYRMILKQSQSPILYTQGRRKGGTLGASAPPMFGRTVNHISTRGADYAHHSTTSPPKFSDLATALTVHLMSALRQPGSKQMYHYIREAKSLLF